MADRLGPRARCAADRAPAAALDASWRLSVGAEARALRRSVGPAAWVVLEELLLVSTRQADGHLVAAVSVRDLAELTGLSKDTVARALRRLLAAGVAVRRFENGGASGAFARVRYEPRVERLKGVTIQAGVERAPVVLRTSVPSTQQGALFDLDGARS